MSNKNENTEAPEFESGDDMSYDNIVDSSVGDLFDRFKKMRSEERMNEVTSYCLAKALSNNDNIKNEDTRLEYLKEAGRNERATIKSDSAGVNDEDDPLFGK